MEDISWNAPEFEYRKKDASWYWASILGAAFVIGFAVWQKNFLFGFFIFVAEMLLIIWADRAPRTVHFTLTETELVIGGGKRYVLKDFQSMSFDESSPPWTELFLYARAKFRAPLRISLGSDLTERVRERLQETIKEIPYEPHFIDSIEKIIGF